MTTGDLDLDTQLYKIYNKCLDYTLHALKTDSDTLDFISEITDLVAVALNRADMISSIAAKEQKWQRNPKKSTTNAKTKSSASRSTPFASPTDA